MVALDMAVVDLPVTYRRAETESHVQVGAHEKM